eukprot:scaffold6.g2801.t1
MVAIATACPARARFQVASRTALAGGRPVVAVRSAVIRPARRAALVVRQVPHAHTGGADRSSSGGFLSGFVVGGVIFGVLGFVFAPQISKALLGDDERLKLPRFMEEQDPEVTKQNLADKIAQLNAAIDDVSAQLKANDTISSKDDLVLGAK